MNNFRKFGFSNSQAVREGLTGTDCRGEEHEVVLIWSVRSGRVQVICNQKDITKLGSFTHTQEGDGNVTAQNGASSSSNNMNHAGGMPRRHSNSELASHNINSNTSTDVNAPVTRGRKSFTIPSIPKLSRNGSNETNSQDSVNSRRSTRSSSPSAPSFIEFSWRTATHHTITVRAHVQCPPAGYHQYDLLIDGRSFLSLPTAHNLGSKEYAYQHRNEATSTGGGRTSPRTNAGSPVSHSEFSHSQGRTKRQPPSSSQKARRRPPSPYEHPEAAVSAHHMGMLDDELMDDLHSPRDRAMQMLRDDVTASIPGTSMMMSHAIICAFSEERDLNNMMPDEVIMQRARVDAIVYETDCLYSAYEWMKWNSESTAHDTMDRKNAFMQTQINKMVAVVRHNLVSPAAASQAIHSVAAVLKLDLATPLPRNTIVLFGMRKDVSRDNLQNALQIYGRIEGVTVASGNKGFGVCRFRASSAMNRALNASFRDEINIQEVSPQIRELSQLASAARSPPAIPATRRAVSASAMPHNEHSQQIQKDKTRTLNYSQSDMMPGHPSTTMGHSSKSGRDRDPFRYSERAGSANAAGLRAGMTSMNINRGPPPPQARSFSRDYSSNQQQSQHQYHNQQQYQSTQVRRPSLDAGGRYQPQTQSNIHVSDKFRFDDNFDQVPVRKPSLDYTGRYHPPSTDFPSSKQDFQPFATHDELMDHNNRISAYGTYSTVAENPSPGNYSQKTYNSQRSSSTQRSHGSKASWASGDTYAEF